MTAESGAPLQGRIFISYRRQETAAYAGWLYDRLVDPYPAQVFKDVDSIEPGDDFVEVITAAVGSCDVLLALIGDQWLTLTDEAGRRRLDDPDDFVRVEIEAALTRKVRVIPILVDGATMPRADELPESLAGLVRRNALELTPTRFDYDTSRLVKVLDRTLKERSAARGVTAHPKPPVAPTGLRGSIAAGWVHLWWDPPMRGAVAGAVWQVRRDGTRVADVTEPHARDQPPGPGFYRYTVTTVSTDGQASAETEELVVAVRNPPVAPDGLYASTAPHTGPRQDAALGALHAGGAAEAAPPDGQETGTRAGGERTDARAAAAADAADAEGRAAPAASTAQRTSPSWPRGSGSTGVGGTPLVPARQHEHPTRPTRPTRPTNENPPVEGPETVAAVTGSAVDSLVGGPSAPPRAARGRVVAVVGVLALLLGAGAVVVPRLVAGSDGGIVAPTSATAVLPQSAAPLPPDQLLFGMEDHGNVDLYVTGIGSAAPVRRLTTRKTTDRSPALSPDRRTVVYVNVDDHDADEEGPRTLRVAGVDGSGDRVLFDSLPKPCRGSVSRPAWDPADTSILVLSCVDTEGGSGLYRVRTDGTQLGRVVQPGPGISDPTFSPDGSKLVFWSGPRSARDGGSLYVTTRDGKGEPRYLLKETREAQYGNPVFSPDGTRIAYRRRDLDGTSGGEFNIYVMRADGSGEPKRLVGVAGSDESSPAYSASGDQIAYKSNAPKSADDGQRVDRVWIVDKDGSDPHLLLTDQSTGKQTAPAW